MLNLEEERLTPQNPGEPRQFYTYNGYFGGFLRKDGFGLHGKGIFHIDATQNKIEVSGEKPLPLIISMPLGLIPVVGRAIRTLYRPSASFTFQPADVGEFVRAGRGIQFKAPKSAGGRLKRVEFTTETDAEAQEIEDAIRRLNPAVTPGKTVTIFHHGWQFAKLGLAFAAVLITLFFVVYAVAFAKRFMETSYETKVSFGRFYSGNSNRKPLFGASPEYPDAAKGLFQRGGFVCLDLTFTPDGSVSDVKLTDRKDVYSKGITTNTNPVLIEAAMNLARQNKYAPGDGELKIQLLYNFKSRFDAVIPPK
ncbi:MAG: hypothetical protein WA584_03860 [Pyrinomonadaceae bacterium]